IAVLAVGKTRATSLPSEGAAAAKTYIDSRTTWAGTCGRIPGGAQHRLGRQMRPKRPSSCAIMRTGRSSSAGRVRLPLPPAPQSFFKLLLGFFTPFWMPRSWHELAPAMPIEEAINRAVIDLVSHPSFKGLLDLGTCEEGSEEVLLLLQGQ